MEKNIQNRTGDEEYDDAYNLSLKVTNRLQKSLKSFEGVKKENVRTTLVYRLSEMCFKINIITKKCTSKGNLKKKATISY